MARCSHIIILHEKRQWTWLVLPVLRVIGTTCNGITVSTNDQSQSVNFSLVVLESCYLMLRGLFHVEHLFKYGIVWHSQVGSFRRFNTVTASHWTSLNLDLVCHMNHVMKHSAIFKLLKNFKYLSTDKQYSTFSRRLAYTFTWFLISTPNNYDLWPSKRIGLPCNVGESVLFLDSY